MAETRRGYIFGSFLLSLVCTILILVSLATDSWVVANMRAPGEVDDSSFRYGLFGGELTLRVLFTPTYHELHMVCIVEMNACAVSCKTTPEVRREEVIALAEGATPTPVVCDDRTSIDTSRPIMAERPVISAAVYIITNILIFVQLLFAVCSSLLAILNATKNPTEPIFGLLGVEISSGICAVTGSIVLLLWGIYYATSGLSNHLAFSYVATQQADFTTLNSTIGYSFWILIPTVVCAICSLVLVEVRRYVLERDPPAPTIQIENHSDGTIFLY